MLITQRGTIRAGHIVRGNFAGVSTDGHASYFDSKGSALRAFEAVLGRHGLCFDPDDFLDMSGNEGRINIAIHTNPAVCDDWSDDDDENGDRVGSAIISWHRMESGRYEFTGYIT